MDFLPPVKPGQKSTYTPVRKTGATSAIASGQFGASPALAARLQAAEEGKRKLTERLEGEDRYSGASPPLVAVRDTTTGLADMLANLP